MAMDVKLPCSGTAVIEDRRPRVHGGACAGCGYRSPISPISRNSQAGAIRKGDAKTLGIARVTALPRAIGIVEGPRSTSRRVPQTVL